MKPTSHSSKSGKRKARGSRVKVSTLTEEDRVLQFLKDAGARPMTAIEKRELAKAGCLGMPEE
jgi:hypothetical protein